MRQNVTDIMDTFKISIGILNTRVVKIGGIYIALLEIYEKFIKNYSMDSVDFNLIRSNDYIRGPVSLMFKYVFYVTIMKKYGRDLDGHSHNLSSLFLELRSLRMKRIIKLLKLFKNDIWDKI